MEKQNSRKNWQQRTKKSQVQLSVWIPVLMMKNLKLEAAQKQIRVVEILRQILQNNGYDEEKDWDAVFSAMGIETDFNSKEEVGILPLDLMK